ncbi:hypothetical protein [Lysinibacillus piscis]|uniref:Uncharacterized protein n=1 Tax=Lysinibacillus piscis TaxID=2518931 RepID=A0ABQ5NGR7_9BACI|nr:hypothetical protein [Lysinibacillus sp. KH24]GLC87479.1 hypothetical protein LYSBPC_06060 [Lysinibacillus sp. KH24]
MDRVGNRIFYNKSTGNIIFQTGEAEGNVVPHDDTIEITYLDIPFGTMDYVKSYVSKIDENGNPVVKNYDIPETAEQRRIRELEDALLLATENEVGGIL